MNIKPRLHPARRICLQFFFLTMLLGLVAPSLRAAVVQENFDYPDGTILANTDTAGGAGVGGWYRHTGTGSGTGSKITVNGGAVTFGAVNGHDVYLPLGAAGTINFPFPIANTNPGSIYFGFDVKLAGASEAGDVFFGIASNAASIRAGIRAQSAPGGYLIGYGGTAIAYSPTVLSFGTTYRVVLRYDVMPGTLNNPGWLYVFPADLAGVDAAVEANNLPVISSHIAGTDWDTGIPGPLLAQTPASPAVSYFDNLAIANNFTEAVGEYVVPGPQVVIDEDFSASPADFTVIAGGTWNVTDGRYVLAAPGNAAVGLLGNNSVHNTSLTGDFSLSTLVRITGTGAVWDDAAVVFNFQDASNYYYVSLNESNDGATQGIFKVQNGTYTELADITTVITSDTDYALQVERVGDTITVLLNGTQIATATDATFLSGNVGYGSKNDGAQFDDLMVIGTIGAPSVVAAPAFTPAAGTYTSAQSVTLTSGTAGAAIRYTLDGSEPTATTGAVYAAPITLGSNATVKAIAYKTGMTSSAVTSAAYVIAIPAQVAAPVFTPAAGTYTSVQSVTLSSATTTATIRYTLDGSEPTATVGTVYSGPIAVESSATLKAIAYQGGMSDSTVTSASYVIAIANQVAAPNFSPAGGSFNSPQSVALATATVGATIRYTVDGSLPTATTGAVYAGPISIETTTTVKAIAAKSGLVDSAVVSAYYSIDLSVASFGPNGTHWPELLPTPFMYDTSVPHIIDVDCNWTAIRNALAAVTPAQAAAGVLIRVAPGALPGNGSGSTSTPVLQNLGSTEWTKRVTVAPRDGYGTVTIGIVNATGARIHNVHGVCFAGFIAHALRPSGCINSAIAWTKITWWLGISASTNFNSSNMELVEVVLPNLQVRDTDSAESATSTNGANSNFHFVGCYIAPSYRTTGAAHTDTLQFFGSSAYSNMVFKDTVIFSSSNCAIQTGNLDGLKMIHSYIVAEAPALSRYPFPEGYTPPNPLDVTKTFNGGGQNFEAYDSIFIGRMPYATSPWSVVSNTRVTEAVSLMPSGTGSWTVDASLATSTPEDFGIPLPTDAYLESIWGESVVPPSPVSAPAFSPEAGTYTSAQSVTLTSSTTGASIRYTTDDSAPTATTGTIYSAPIEIGSTTTLKAIAYKDGLTNSTVTSATYIINIAETVLAPVFNPAGGSYTTAQSVTITTPTAGATVRYTTDGSEPTSSSGTIYTAEISIASSTTLKAVAFKNELPASNITSASYIIDSHVASFGPNGTHWPELLPTPFLYDTSIPHVIDVDCSWTAIRDALAAVTPEQAAAGVLIRVAPGALTGNGSGAGSTPVLQNLGSTEWTKRVTVAPRDGYGTVTIGIVNTQGARIHNVHGVCFAGFIAHALRPSGCINSAIAWTKITWWLGISASTNFNSSNMELVEVVLPNLQIRDTDSAESATSTNGANSNFQFIGCYIAPSYRANGSAHTDSLQFFGTSAYSNMVFKDTVIFSSSNCAIQTGDLNGLKMIHSYIVAEAPALSRYPFPEGYTPPNPLDVTKTFNGGGQNFEAYDSIFIGRMPYATSPWSVVSNTRVTEAVSLAPGATGAWTVDPTLKTSTPEDFGVPLPTDAYLNSIWSAPVTLTNYEQWKVAQGLSADAPDTSTPANDGITLLFKYATMGSATVSQPSPVAFENNGGALTLAFSRRTPAPVDYLVETSIDLVNWQPLAALAAGTTEWTGSAAVVETAIDAESRSVAVAVPTTGDSRRFFRLAVTHAGTTVSHQPTGYARINLNAGASSSYLGQPLLAPAVYRGAVTSFTATQIAVDGTPFIPGVFTASAYWLRIVDGAQAGRHALITANDASSITVDVQDNSPEAVALNVVGWSLAVGDQVEIAPADTLASLFGSTVTPGASLFVADTVGLWDGTRWVSYYRSTTQNAWLGQFTGNTPQDNLVIAPQRAWVITRRAGRPASSLLLTGAVPESRQLLRHAGASTTMSTVRFPVAQTLASFAFEGPGLWNSATTFAVADSVGLWDGTRWISYWRLPTGQWRKQGDATNADQSALVIEPGRAVSILRRATASGPALFLSQPQPYSDPRQ